MSASPDPLVAILQLAYSGERAAAYAYAGHWRSVRREEDRVRIHTIESEELKHRQWVGEMLTALGQRPDWIREIRASIIGRTLGLLCHVTGWFAPMYGAGRLERRNICEYEQAARLARDAGHGEFVDCLLTMAEVEWEHELYFRTCAQSYSFAKWIHIWPAPPPKDEIRKSFEREGMSSIATNDSNFLET